MKYIICTEKDCENPLIGCQQGSRVFLCESDCWGFDYSERPQCPKDAGIYEKKCSACRDKDAPKSGV